MFLIYKTANRNTKSLYFPALITTFYTVKNILIRIYKIRIVFYNYYYKYLVFLICVIFCSCMFEILRFNFTSKDIFNDEGLDVDSKTLYLHFSSAIAVFIILPASIIFSLTTIKKMCFN